MLNISDLTTFPCTACGQCCRRIHLSEMTAFLDRGDGICHHLDCQTNLCQIYNDRPLVCRVEDYYKTYLINQISWEEFVDINVQVCKNLQN
ncbi:YkgJ family cysteine cluster protein [Moraxella nasicaprae]|uniref:YkgJ family cysteine cluster protein n=1 Tax=Moraxella nasicaprae TaxID=2904122 RepID=A0ABY6F6X5_9GAMM|nr:YkgJ family cysteine cluster protein [Moraxella nasicaprae]UXZ05860.1 YkgJ family cysteine cluster protein [Moraxella nasicaprae]